MYFNLPDDLLIHKEKFHLDNSSLDKEEAQILAVYNRRSYRKTVVSVTNGKKKVSIIQKVVKQFCFTAMCYVYQVVKPQVFFKVTFKTVPS